MIGGGYIGLEAATVLRETGKNVTLLETLNRVLARVAGEPISRFVDAEHISHGVDVRHGFSIEAIEGERQLAGVRLKDGQTIGADLVLVGIGILPSIEPLFLAGADVDNGILVDGMCGSSLTDIYAIGD